jgi:hypothetical protein
MRRRMVLPKLYSALFELSGLEDGALRLGGEIPGSEAARLLGRVQALETKALHLLDRIETQQRPAAH